MANIRELRLKIKTVGNIKKITEAMEAVAANKMRRNQDAALLARPYAQKAMALLANLSAGRYADAHPLLAQRAVKKTLLVAFSADKGLCGPYNSNVFKAVDRLAHDFDNRGVSLMIYSLGKKAHNYALRQGLTEYGFSEGLGDTWRAVKITDIAAKIIDGFRDSVFDEVHLIYNHFLSTLSQRVARRQLLPFSAESLKQMMADVVARGHEAGATERAGRADYTFEPNESLVLESLLPQLVKTQMWHALLEANASEHSARLMAMKNANKNAGELLTNLKLTFNKARQAGITQEISEIVTGAEALTLSV